MKTIHIKDANGQKAAVSATEKVAAADFKRKKTTYELDGKTIEIEMPDDKAEEYMRFQESEKRAEEREKWRQRKKLTSLDAMKEKNEDIADRRADFTDAVIAHDELHQALIKLSEGQRQVIELYFFEGYKVPEIAQKIGVHKTAVYKLMQRALASLKKYLKNF